MKKDLVLGGLVLLSLWLISGIQAVKRLQDVGFHGKQSNAQGHHSLVRGWSPYRNTWDEQLYPAWKAGDARWENCWRGGKVEALLTSDSPALIGSNITFAVTLRFPRCQKENDDGDIVYDRKCRNDSFSYQDQYVYNWTKWVDDCNEGNCTFINKFPDGRPFPPHPDWRRRNFVYIFQTLDQFYSLTGRSSAVLSINTTNITAGTQMMEVSVYRRDHRRHYPVAKASAMYIVTEQIPLYVNISQKNDRNSSDKIFIKDSPITFDVKLHDPSHYLAKAAVSFNWTFGDGSGSFVSNNPLSSHTYTLLGNFSLNLTVKAAIPGPCKPVTPTTFIPTTYTSSTTTAPVTSNSTGNSTDLPFTETAFVTTEGSNVTTAPTTETTTHIQTTPAAGCFIDRYGYYKANIRIVDGIVEVNIVEMTNVSPSEAQKSSIDFVVACQGSIPTDACTIISDSTCTIPQNEVCDEVVTTDECLVTLRRAFTGPGTYCVNITLGDDASLALASTLVSVSEAVGTPVPVKEILIYLGLVAVIIVAVGVLLSKKCKGYNCNGKLYQDITNEGLNVTYNQIKLSLLKNDEHHPLLKNKAGVI
ncbi:transmembrane glyco NMB [Pelobates cultripes]|uniref:Transmembrane glyco NMB n=1 Tax=Pelobates cultripes TaxID=61616 RepID=A0AAD1RWJ9_PELCU|nr:transmembrane glyco NMB [Pelobates cultripes]